MIFRRSSNKGSGTANPKEPVVKKSSNTGPSIIGAECVIDGEIRSSGELQIDGTVNGNISATVVVVDMHGTVNGQILAEDVWIRGRVVGPVHGKNVTIVANAHVEGDIINQTIAIENGAYIDGRVHRVDDPLSAASATGYETSYSNYSDIGQQNYSNYSDDGDIEELYNVERLRPRSKAAE